MANWLNILPVQAVVVVAVIAFLFGTVLASFIGCVAWRFQTGESPWKGRSHCDGCGRTLGVLELVPIVGWIACKGRCRKCGCSVSARGPITEALLGVVFVLIVLRFGLGVPTIVYCVLAVLLLGLTLIDLDSMIIPNKFVIAIVIVWALGVVASVFAPADATLSAGAVTSQVAVFGIAQPTWLGQLAEGALGGIVMGVVLLVFCMAFEKITGKTGFGGGDIKLMFAVGLFIGLPLSVLNVIISCILGLVFALVLKPKTEDGQSAPFPFGPAIAAATVITLLVGPQLLSWYLGLFF